MCVMILFVIQMQANLISEISVLLFRVIIVEYCSTQLSISI